MKRRRSVVLLLGAGAAVLAAVAHVGIAAETAAYRIGPDDVLQVTVWDQKDLDQTVFVRPDGKISLLLVGEIQAGGVTIGELTSRLTDLYGRTIRNAQVTVTVREIRSRPIFFLGGVAKPGPLQLTQALTLLQALSAAGGLTATADIESAYVLRGEKRIPVDFHRLMQKGDVSQNILLQPGDTVVVPVAEVVYVHGEVKTPGAVKFTRDLTVLKAIVQAGGFTPLASPGRVSLLRTEGDKKESVRVNVSEIMSNPGNVNDLPLRPNDVITVPQRLF
ncbi:MAG: polysaccharide biosynthesis/export family protein [Candidatus Rokuibacteriota bacterium]